MKFIAAGFLGGCLHGLTGPDHVAALLPFVCGSRWHMCVYWGALWGAGHVLSACLMCILMFVFRDLLLSESTLMSSVCGFVGDLLIGLSFVVVGVIGAKESMENSEESDSSRRDDESDVENKSSPLGLEESKKTLQTPKSDSFRTKCLTVFASGLLLGFSWDGLPSLTPVVGAVTVQELLMFVAAYGVGTIGAMALLCVCVGEVCMWLGRTINAITLPSKLSLASSVLACATGVFWVSQVLLRMLLSYKHQVVSAVALPLEETIMQTLAPYETSINRDDLEGKVATPWVLYTMLMCLVPLCACVVIICVVVADVFDTQAYNNKNNPRTNSSKHAVVEAILSSSSWWRSQWEKMRNAMWSRAAGHGIVAKSKAYTV